MLPIAAGILVMPPPALGRRPRPASCPGGRFLLDDANVLASVTGGAVGALDISDSRLTLAGCPDGRPQIKAVRRATSVRAHWARCGTAERVRLRLRIVAPGCDTLAGTLAAKKRGRRRFTARRETAITTSTTTTTSTTLPTSNLPPSEMLIEEALRAGRIDYATSLVYRAWVLFHDERLPEEFDGADAAGDDALFFREVELKWPALPAETRAALQPFRVRPADRRSAFGPRPSAPAARRGSEAAVARQAAAAAAASTVCSTRWTSDPTPLRHFRIWLCATADAAQDASVHAIVAAIADEAWDAMTPAMGPPLPDDDGGDELIDVYLLAPNQCRVRDGACRAISGDSVAVAWPATPITQNTAGRTSASGFIALDRTRLDEIKLDFVHEFFHVLQYAHSFEAGMRDTGLGGDGRTVWDKSWFVEASATWAEWAYAPEFSAVTHQHFTSTFQQSWESLLEDNGLHPYSAYIWPYFVQQERGGPGAIVRAWFAAEGAADPGGIDDAVDQQLPFATHFRDFATRNLNVFLPGDPLAPRHVAQDPIRFPDDVPPSQVTDNPNPAVITPSFAREVPIDVEPLAAQYDRYVVDPTVEGITFDFSGAVPADRLDVDAVVDLAGTWKRVQAVSGVLTFCRARPEEAVGQIFLVLANHDRTRGEYGGAGAALGGRYTISAGPCSSSTTTTTTTTLGTPTTTPSTGPVGCMVGPETRSFTETFGPLSYHRTDEWVFDHWLDNTVFSDFSFAARVTTCVDGICSERLENARYPIGGDHCSPTGELHVTPGTYTDVFPSGQITTHTCTCCFTGLSGCTGPGDCALLHHCCPADGCRAPCDSWFIWPRDRSCPFGEPPPTTTTLP